jgi:hypothetical protein
MVPVDHTLAVHQQLHDQPQRGSLFRCSEHSAQQGARSSCGKDQLQIIQVDHRPVGNRKGRDREFMDGLPARPGHELKRLVNPEDQNRPGGAG